MQHQSRPAPTFPNPPLAKPSLRPLTKPKSPKFGNRRVGPNLTLPPPVEIETVQQVETEQFDDKPTINAFRNVKLRPIARRSLVSDEIYDHTQ